MSKIFENMDIREMLKLTTKNQKKITVAIIGTSGRNFDPLLTCDMYYKMIEKAKDILSDYNVGKLISGGSSWSDHIAVNVGEEENIPTTLYIPCCYDIKNRQFNQDSYFGKRLNNLHKKFSQIVNRETLEEIEMCNLIPCKNFWERNEMITTNADMLLAFGPKKISSGTKHTFDLFKGKKIYIDLNTL